MCFPYAHAIHAGISCIESNRDDHLRLRTVRNEKDLSVNFIIQHVHKKGARDELPVSSHFIAGSLGVLGNVFITCNAVF